MTSTNSLIDVSKYNDDENYKKLERKINKLLELYDTTSNRKEKQEILENLNEVKSKLNISSINSTSLIMIFFFLRKRLSTLFIEILLQ